MVEIALDEGVFVPLTVAEKVLQNVLAHLEYLRSRVEGQRSKFRLPCDVCVCVSLSLSLSIVYLCDSLQERVDLSLHFLNRQ